MERHSVPQNIMDVEFKLFGSFTIKQFAYLAAGIVVALLIFFTPLPSLLKLILVPMSALTGIFLGLVRINGQPSTTFVANFIVALFSTQTRIWSKEAKTPDILQESKAIVNPEDADKIVSMNRSVTRAAKLKPLENLVDETEDNELDQVEDARLSEIEKHFDFAVEDLKRETARVDEIKRPAAPPQAKAPVDVTVEQPALVHFDPEEDNLAGSIASKELEGEPIIRTNKYATMFKQMQSQPNRPISSPQQVQKTAEPKTSQQQAQAQQTSPSVGEVSAEPQKKTTRSCYIRAFCTVRQTGSVCNRSERSDLFG
ncbi:MAG: PrgI family protein [candidate division WS6 bacterium OLB20]|uniref:PrgI family protein n=1 Tax=candidate division WS6 bacterium OLB20 TaxID=1617426 RepID=A0A136LX35_9BACT|nr:MAG: PrgI family protein [candidate division WS6 bacterium OLB20]